MKRQSLHHLLLALALLVLMAIACAVGSGTDALSTAVAATLTAISGAEPTTTSMALPSAPPAAPTETPTPPPDGISFLCDGTFQRFRLTDAGEAGKTAWIDNWVDGGWTPVWSLAGGDAMIRQIYSSVGIYQFGGCGYMLAVPIVYGGSGAAMELHVLKWDGATMVEVYLQDGVHADWVQSGESIVFTESLYLFGEPNCCPCNRQTQVHTWNGTAFLETSQVINPTYSGAPPAECVP